MRSLEWKLLWDRWCKAHDKSGQWLDISLQEKGIDKKISHLQYQKYDDICKELIKQLVEISEESDLTFVKELRNTHYARII